MELLGSYILEHQANILEIHTFKPHQKNIDLTAEGYFHILRCTKF